MFWRRETVGDLWSELSRVQDEFNRVLSGRVPAGLPVNLWTNDHTVYAEIDLPDLDPAQLDITVKDGNEITIKGERKAPEVPSAVWVRQERPFGKFSRVLTLPVLVDADKVDATYENGVLKLSIAKSEASKPRKIVVKS